jgi:ribosome-binding protein aMBF1 (putative translation factor)
MGVELGKTVRRARREKGWGISQLSERSGVPEWVIHEIEGESPTYVPREVNTLLLAETLRIPEGLLLGERVRLFER